MRYLLTVPYIIKLPYVSQSVKT